MSYAPPQTTTNIFNGDDYQQNYSQQQQFNNDTSNFVNITGDYMTGQLRVPSIKFSDGTYLTSAITSDTAELVTQQNIMQQEINTNTTKLTNINYDGVITNITNLSIDGQPSVPVSVIEKNKIYANEGNIYTNTIDISQNKQDIQYNTNFRENSIFFDWRISQNTSNIQTNTSQILTLENSVDDHGEQNITHSSNIGINGINVNTLSKNIHNNSIYIYKNTVKCNDLLIRTSIIETEIQQTKTDLIIANNEITDTKLKSLENEQQININTANIINMVPIGTILTTAIPPTIAPPIGYLYCDGTSVSISTYSNLFAILGNTYQYNKQSYSGYFYLPDLRQLFIRGSQQNSTYPVNAQPVSMGTYQGQSIQMHSHTYSKSLSESAEDGGYNGKTVGSNTQADHKTINMFDSANNQIYPASAETRPESISMNYMIRY